MNKFLSATAQQINLHGASVAYTSKGVQTYNPTTSKSTSTDLDYTVKMYPKHIRANQYNYPDLIGKDVVMFYLANNGLGFVPKIGDYITYNSSKYQVNSFQSHAALGSICLYRIVAVKG